MPLIYKHCNSEGKVGRGAYTDGETEFLLSEGLVYVCPTCHQYHLANCTHKDLHNAIAYQVRIVGHTLQVSS